MSVPEREKEAEHEHVVPLASASPETGRLTSLDVFRGVTVAGMILANNSGQPSYKPFKHAPWDGWTPTDLIFPSFLFIVGVSITFALGKRLATAPGHGAIVGKIVRRSLIIFALGIFLNTFPDFNKWNTIRIPGVLQRIALCYLATSLIFLVTGVRGQLVAFLTSLVGYWALMAYVPVPGFGPHDWKQGHDLGHTSTSCSCPGTSTRWITTPKGS